MQRLEGSEGVSHTAIWGRALEGQQWGKALQGSLPEVCEGTVRRGLCGLHQRKNSSRRSERQGARPGLVG